MTFYPPRNVTGAFGTVFFGLFIVAMYRYSHVQKPAYAIIAALTLCMAVYLIMPVVRNQIVEITSDGIIIRSFGKKTLLTKADLYEIEYHHTCIASYQFAKDKQFYQVTPIAYNNGSIMLQEFQRIFGS